MDRVSKCFSYNERVMLRNIDCLIVDWQNLNGQIFHCAQSHNARIKRDTAEGNRCVTQLAVYNEILTSVLHYSNVVLAKNNEAHCNGNYNEYSEYN